MNMLCGHHSQDPEICQWVIDNYKDSVGNITVELWVQACRDRLAELGIDYTQK